MNKILLQGSITLAQIFVINMDGYDYRVKEDIGENIIRYIYKWFGKEDSDETQEAVDEFRQHNEDCRYECYCCGECEGHNDFPENKPSINDKYIKNIQQLLWNTNSNNFDKCDDTSLDELFGEL